MGLTIGAKPPPTEAGTGSTRSRTAPSEVDRSSSQSALSELECSLLPRRPCRFGGARRPRAWCRRCLSLTGCSRGSRRRGVPLRSRHALRGVFWHVRAWHRRQEARLPCLRPRACERAHQARRRSARVFELAARDEPAWLVARREPAQHALGTLYSLDKGATCRPLSLVHLGPRRPASSWREEAVCRHSRAGASGS